MANKIYKSAGLSPPSQHIDLPEERKLHRTLNTTLGDLSDREKLIIVEKIAGNWKDICCGLPTKYKMLSSEMENQYPKDTRLEHARRLIQQLEQQECPLSDLINATGTKNRSTGIKIKEYLNIPK